MLIMLVKNNKKVKNIMGLLLIFASKKALIESADNKLK